MSALLELPFQEAQRLFNCFYYQQGGRHALDFSARASQGTRLAYSEADEFHSSLSRRFRKNAPDEVRVLELGCGDGSSAARFLERMGQLDRKTGTCFMKRLNYTLADSSSQMLRDAVANRRLKSHLDQTDFILTDAESPQLTEGNFLLARSNGLFDGLPTQLIVMERGAFHEVRLQMHLENSVRIMTHKGVHVPHREFAWLARNRFPCVLNEIDGSFVKKLEFEVRHAPVKLDSTAHMLLHSTLGRIPPGLTIPIPFSAASCAAAVRPLLAPGGIFDSFDCGFNSLGELQALQPAIFRTPGVLTTFVNFRFLKAIAPLLGYKSASVEPQHKFSGGRQLKTLYHLRLKSGE